LKKKPHEKKKKTLSQRRKSTYKQNRAESVPFLIVFTANVLKHGLELQTKPFRNIPPCTANEFFTTYKHQ